MRIHLIVCINRRANDTFKSPFAFRQASVKLEGHDEMSLSVNMCDINMDMPNWSRGGVVFIILALAWVQGRLKRRWRVWNRPNSVGAGGFNSREEVN